MKLRTLLAALFVTVFGAAPALAQVCDPPHAPYAGYAVTYPPPAQVVYGNPCAPYAWCGPRDAWGNPVYVAPAYNAYPDMSAYGAARDVYEATRPQVNGWTGAVEERRYSPYDILVLN